MVRFTFPPTHPAAPAEVEDVIVPRARDIGEMTVHRALPSRQRQMVGPFIFFDQMGPAEFGPDEGLAVRPHPHIGLATVTYLFGGVIRHRDSLGNTKDITPGAVNWMTAGRGIAHSERTPEELSGKTKRTFGIQTWVALPKAHEETDPAFEHVAGDALPRLEEGGIDLRVILGRAYGAEAPVKVFSDMLYADARLAPGAVLPLPDDHEDRAAYVVEGSVTLGDAEFASGELVVFGDGPVALEAGPAGARLMLVGGEVADGPRHIWWNFVASSQEKIDAAKEDWARRSLGRFELPTDDRDEFIPAPGEDQATTKTAFYP